MAGASRSNESGEPAEPDAGDTPPPGYVFVPVRTTYLEMRRDASGPTAAAADTPDPPAGCEMRRWRKPPLDEYRQLFSDVGGPWGWTGRLLQSDDEVRGVLDDERVEIWRLFSGGEVAGFIELDRRLPGEIEVVYFGLRDAFIGRGLGPFVLRWAARHAWSDERVERLWLHTCDYDHPAAIGVYERAGFRIYDERSGPEIYPAEHVARVAATRSAAGRPLPRA